ncbi:MAG TPA: fibronectin type III domain-containing protein [Mycobacteriales bacterium]|nr:fibronectin type III domain-containing protein [Mycobacteriales bacterium]
MFVSGCKASGFLNEINATQPDVSLDGNTYVFQVGANHMVSGCTKNGGADTLADCVANSAYSAYFTFTTDRIISGRPHTWPDAPTGVAAQRGDQSADVSWTAPVNDGGATVTSYQVTASPGGATCTWTTGPLGCTVSGLTNGTAYTFTVTATNAVGTGPASAASTAVTPAGLPSPPVTVAANPGDGAATVSWSAADANGSAVTGYAVTSSPDGMTCSTTGATQCTVSGLTNGTAYTFTVTTTNDIGTSTSSGASPAVTVGTPTAPTSVTASAGDHQATVSWTASAGNAAPVSSYDVLGSPGGLTCSTTGATVCTVTGLTNGTSYTFTVTATNTVGSGPPSLPSAPVTPADTTAPTVTTEATPVFTLTGHVGLSYTGHDLSSGVASYDVRYRRAPYNGGFGGYQYPASGTSDWQATTKTSVSLAVPRGYTYCLSVRARDVAGNVSGWSAERCTATALDDRALTASTGWTRGKGSVYYAGTVTATKTKQVQLSLSHVTARRLAVVVTRLSGGGTIGIYWKGTLIKKISLSASSTKNRQVISLPAFATTRTGTVTIKTLTAGTTRIDGLGVSAR